jgi:hypothetical protein
MKAVTASMLRVGRHVAARYESVLGQLGEAPPSFPSADSNLSIDRTSSGKLRLPAAAAHVKR